MPYWRKSFIKITTNAALKIEGNTVNAKYVNGYAITPALSYSGDATLSFEYSKSTAENTTFTVTIQGGGSFEDGTTEKQLTAKTKHTDGSETATLKLIGIKEADTKIKFATTEKKYFVIDDVKVTKIPEIALSEAADNSTTLSENSGQTVSALTTRTLRGGIWNTLCLPFGVDLAAMEQALGSGQDIQMRTYSGYADGVLTFAEATAVEAGTPMLVKLNTTVENPTFHAVTVSTVAAKTITQGDVSFVGTYSPTALATDGTALFLTTDNKLGKPAATTNTLGGMRAYFAVPASVDIAGSARLDFSPSATAVTTPTAPVAPAAVYTLSGQRLGQPRKGLNIVGGKLTVVK